MHCERGERGAGSEAEEAAPERERRRLGRREGAETGASEREGRSGMA